MNYVLLSLNLLGGDLKKQASIVFATITVILALPAIAVLSMGSTTLAYLDNTPNMAVAETMGFYMGGPVEGNTYSWGNCTYWAFAMRLWAGSPIPTSWGNANTWDDRARNDGYIVDNTPSPGAVFQTDEGEWGHVAYVIRVDSASGDWVISEMNAPNLNVVSQRTFPKSAAQRYSFIHTKKGADPWTPLPISNPSLRTGTPSS